MSDVRLMYDKEFLGAWDIPAGGVVAVIDRCEQGALHIKGTSRKERKPILFFQGQDKGMILNATNREAVAGLYGYNVTAWPGQPVRLIVAKTKYDGKQVDAIRVSPKKPVGQAAASPAPALPAREPGDDSEEDDVDA